jgi:YfaZ precursor
MLKKLGLISVITASAFAMHGVDININDKDLELGGNLDVGQFVNTVEPNTVFVGGRYLKGNESHSDFSSNSNPYYEANFLMQKPIGSSDFTLGMGVKLNYTQCNDLSGKTLHFTSLPLGLEVGYKLPVNTPVPLRLGGQLYYAPEVLSMNDAKNFLETRVNLDIEVIQNGNVTIGYRTLNTNYNDGGQTLNASYNRSAYAGFKFNF